jgi:hypothetical protein
MINFYHYSNSLFLLVLIYDVELLVILVYYEFISRMINFLQYVKYLSTENASASIKY